MKPAEPLVDTLRMWLKVFMHRSMQDYLRFSKDNHLSMSHLGALGQIEHKGEEGVSTLGERLGISKAAASQLLDRLVQEDFISRTEDPNDRRHKQLVLTEHGRAILRDGMNARMRWLEELAATMTPEEQEQVRAALMIMIERANQLEKVSHLEG